MRFEKVSYEQFKKDVLPEAQKNSPEDNATMQIYDDINLPRRATKGSAGYDIFSPVGFTLAAGKAAIIHTGIRVILNDDKFLAIYPRSGLGFKYKVQLFNTIGIIDSDYSNSDNEGHILVKLYNDSPEGKTLVVHQGEAICQGVIQKYFTVDGDSADGKRNGGFGSTG